eukprot:6738890-Prorocentrum_lima.AAC.1
MTSSLVGSEMCIRDRLWQAAPARHSMRGQQLSVVSASVQHQCVQYIYRPVSYTHLTLPTICSV